MNNKKRLLTKRIGTMDFPLLVTTIILVMIGVVAVFSASYYSSISESGSPYGFVLKQGIFAVMGMGFLVLASKMNYHVWRSFSAVILIGSFFLLCLVLTGVGSTVNGATRWIRFFGFSIMPGEISKFSMIIAVGAYLSANPKRVKSLKGLLPVVVLLAVSCGLIMMQPNFSVAATLAVIIMGMLVVAGLKTSYLVGGAGIMAAGIIFAIIGDRGGYRFARFTSFLHPFKDASGDSFQVVQSLMALGSGGFGGVGIGKSVQKTMYLPEPHNDFILAIIGEEVGFVGIAIILALYVIFIWRGVIIAINAPDLFGTLIASGVVAMVSAQVIFNLGVVTSSLPATGVALPFISYGGNALIIFTTCAGILLNISKKRTIERNYIVEKYIG
ncbi:MAG: putative lipid II flippase FtsW [Anaerovoracaceae bacterium]|nr:putative lipid II flippase FtsW [Anaerovoracaceae bacterium]